MESHPADASDSEPPPTYGEADRAWELDAALQLAPGVPRGDEIWTASVRDAGTANDGSTPLSIVTISPRGLTGVLVGFESVDLGSPVSVADRLLAILCRAIVFPMSRRTPLRPWKVVVSDASLLDPAMVEAKLGIIVEAEGAANPALTPILDDHACHVCGNMMLKVFRCGKCRAVKYCGTKCQTLDWPRHKAICKALAEATKGAGPEPLQGPFEFSSGYGPSEAQIERTASQILAASKLDGVGLYRAPIVAQSFSFTDRLAQLDTAVGLTDGFPEPLTEPRDPFGQQRTGFSEAPATIASWADFLAACGLVAPSSHPFPLLLSFPLTVWHTLSHVVADMERSYAGYPLKRSKLALRNGAHYVIHVVAADQWQVELAPLAEFIVPLLRGVTLDIFLVGPQIVVEPMAKGGGTAPVPIAEKGAEEKQQPATGDAVASAKETPVESMTAPQRAMLRRTQSSVELKSDKYESCVRVHVARSPYMYPPESSSFPIDKYPPDLVMTFGSVPNPGEERALDATRLMLRTCDFPARFVVNVDVNWLAALESREAVEVKRPKGRQFLKPWGPVENPFRQPWRRSQRDAEVPVYGNGVLWGWAC